MLYQSDVNNLESRQVKYYNSKAQASIAWISKRSAPQHLNCSRASSKFFFWSNVKVGCTWSFGSLKSWGPTVCHRPRTSREEIPLSGTVRDTVRIIWYRSWYIYSINCACWKVSVDIDKELFYYRRHAVNKFWSPLHLLRQCYVPFYCYQTGRMPSFWVSVHLCPQIKVASKDAIKDIGRAKDLNTMIKGG